MNSEYQTPPHPDPRTSLLTIDQNAILHTITEIYTIRKQFPTLMTIHQALTEDIEFAGSFESLQKMMHLLGDSWKKTTDESIG